MKKFFKSLFSDNNSINEKSFIGFLSFMMMVVFAVADIITGSLGKELVIQEGENANITLFNPDLEWEFTADDIKSKSFNTPFIGEKLKGKALAIYNNGQFKEC